MMDAHCPLSHASSSSLASLSTHQSHAVVFQVAGEDASSPQPSDSIDRSDDGIPDFSYNLYSVLASSPKLSICSSTGSLQSHHLEALACEDGNKSPIPLPSPPSFSPLCVSTSRPQSVICCAIVNSESLMIEEFGPEEYERWNSELDFAIRPYQYEDAGSDSPQLDTSSNDLDSKIACEFRHLSTDNALDDLEAWEEALRAQRRRRRRRSSVQKRTYSMSIGSDTDDEDLQPVTFDANEVGSSARRLRRRVGERASLIFDDPPERIEEVDEGSEKIDEANRINRDGWSVREVEGDLQRELPYWSWEQVMDFESDSEIDD